MRPRAPHPYRFVAGRHRMAVERLVRRKRTTRATTARPAATIGTMSASTAEDEGFGSGASGLVAPGGAAAETAAEATGSCWSSGPGGGAGKSSTVARAGVIPSARASTAQTPGATSGGYVTIVSKCPFGASSMVASSSPLGSAPTRTIWIGPVEGRSPRMWTLAPGDDRGVSRKTPHSPLWAPTGPETTIAAANAAAIDPSARSRRVNGSRQRRRARVPTTWVGVRAHDPALDGW